MNLKMMHLEIMDEDQPAVSRAAKLADFIQLTKPRITAMVLIAAAVAAALAAGGLSNLWLLIGTIVGVFLVSASGSAANQYLERYTDYLMRRTAERPLPDQRLRSNEVALFAAITLGVGVAWLATLVSWKTAVAAVLTWLIYVFVYTPLKVITWLNTYVGAVAGAMPVLIAAIGVSGTVSPVVWSYFAVLFLWQFPHFMAIAWLYRDQYTEGGLQMLPVVDKQGTWTAGHAIAFAVMLIPVSLLPLRFQPIMPWFVGVGVLVIGLSYLAASIHFWKTRDDQSARVLLRTSLVYLPCYMLALVLTILF